MVSVEIDKMLQYPTISLPFQAFWCVTKTCSIDLSFGMSLWYPMSEGSQYLA